MLLSCTYVFRSETYLTSLLVLFFLLLFLLGRPLQKGPRLRRFKSDRYEIWPECSSRNTHRLTERDFFSIWCHTFKMAAMMSFHATKCCHLVSDHEALAGAYAAASVSSWQYSQLWRVRRNTASDHTGHKNIRGRNWPWCGKAVETPPLMFWGSGAVDFSGLGVRCGRMNVVYFTTRLYRGVRAELLVRTAHFQFIPGKQTITLRLNPNPIPNPNPKPNPKSHCNPNNRLVLNSYPGMNWK